METLGGRVESKVRPMSDISIELEESVTNFPKDPSVFLVSGHLMPFETENGIQGESGESNLRDEHKETSAGLLQALLSVEYYIGLCPFRISEDGNITGHCVNKIIFVTLNVLALVQNVINIRFFIHMVDHKYTSDNLGFLGIGTALLIFLLQIRYSMVLWSQRNDFIKLHNIMKRSPVVAHVEERTWLFVIARVVSIAVTAACIFGGLNTFGMEDSMWGILQSYELDLTVAFTDAHKYQNEITNLTGGANNTMSILDDNPDIETIVLGVCGMCLDFLNQIFQSCPCDLLLLVAVIIWLHMKRVDINDEMETTQEEAEEKLRLHEELFRISDQANKLIATFLPILVITSAVMTSHLMHLVFIRSWYHVIFLTIKLSKLFFTFWLATWTAGKEETYHAWFASDHALQVLTLDSNRYAQKVRRMEMAPIGVGTSSFYMNTKFIASYFSIVISHFMIMMQSIESHQQEATSCK